MALRGSALLAAFAVAGPFALAHVHKASLPLTPVQLCVSVPLGVPPLHDLSQSAVNAALLATERWTTRFRQARLTLLPPLVMDDAIAQSNSTDPKREAANARRCIRTNASLGYIGPLNSGVAEQSEPILNEAGMVQISGANTLADLTGLDMRATLEPATFRRRYLYPTYYRTVATDNLQGPADATLLRFRLRLRSYFIVSDPVGGDRYADLLRQGMRRYGDKIGLRTVGSASVRDTSVDTTRSDSEAIANLIIAKGARAVFMATDSLDTTVLFVKTLRRQGYRGPIVGGDLILSPAFLGPVGSAGQNVYSVSVGLDPAGVAKQFRLEYVRRFHSPLVDYTAGFYDAANIELDAIDLAARRGTLHGTIRERRAAILPLVAHTYWRGALGATSFDANGDTRNPLVSLYKVRYGKWAFIGIAPKLADIK